jgi:hypothetical protein
MLYFLRVDPSTFINPAHVVTIGRGLGPNSKDESDFMTFLSMDNGDLFYTYLTPIDTARRLHNGMDLYPI